MLKTFSFVQMHFFISIEYLSTNINCKTISSRLETKYAILKDIFSQLVIYN